ncbi:hypothetical protein [Luteolibacter sp. Populi]|uniref:hypothetical protein n=1 Tax=Luteolibacter sp. Populi TaxID=3230487 RepID=UPI003466DF1D
MDGIESTTLELGPNQSAKLSAVANDWPSVFIVACRESAPGDPTRWRLHLVKADVKTATDALDVIAGKATAKRTRQKAIAESDA